jgi:hypothetical protein
MKQRVEAMLGRRGATTQNDACLADDPASRIDLNEIWSVATFDLVRWR